MAKIIGGSSVVGSGGESNIPASAAPGSIVYYDESGTIIAGKAGDVNVNSVTAESDANASAVNSEALFVKNQEGTAGVTADETGVSIVDQDTGTAAFVSSDGITVGGVVLTDEMVKGIVAANPSSDHRLLRSDETADPAAHGVGAHTVGMIGHDSQVIIAPSDYTGNLAGISEEGDPSQKDINLILDSLDLGSPASSLPANSILPQGILSVPPATVQTSGASNFTVNSTNIKIALAWTPEIDMLLESISMHVGAVTAQGDLALTLHDNSLGGGFESDGNLESWQDSLPLAMTSNNNPSPYVVGMADYTGANCENAPSQATWKAFSLDITQVAAATVTPSAGQPVYPWLDMGPNPEFPINAGAFLNSNNGNFPTAWTVWGADGESLPDVTNDSLWTQIGGAFTATAPLQYLACPWRAINGHKYRFYRWKITAVNTNYCAFHMHIYKPNHIDIPGTQLASLGTLNSGSGAGWIRGTFSGQQCPKGAKRWLVSTGVTGINAGLSYNRITATPGSEHQTGVECLVSSDGGATWRHLYLNAAKFRCLFNWVLNSMANHVPYLYYGRSKGKYTPNYESSAWAQKIIPEAGIKADLDGLTADAWYHAYTYDNAGTMALDISSTAPVTQDGIQVKSGDTAKTWVGCIMPWTYFTSHVGPISKKSRRCVWNAYNKRVKAIGRTNPYYAVSLSYEYGIVGDTTIDGNWNRVGAGIWDLFIVTGEPISLHLTIMNGGNDAYGRALLYSLDGADPGPLTGYYSYTIANMPPQQQIIDIPPGAHKLLLVSVCGVNQNTIVRWYATPGNNSVNQFAVAGAVEV